MDETRLKKQLFVGNQVEKQVDETALSVNKFKKRGSTSCTSFELFVYEIRIILSVTNEI